MLASFLWTIHVMICVILIIVVLLQAGKGSSVGLSFGGGASQTVFGSSGGKSFFAKLTSVLAILFMLTSILLTVMSSRTSQTYRGLMRQIPNMPESPASQSSSPENNVPPAVPAPE